MSEGPVAAVVLAAGESRRFGGRKQLAMFEGRTLLEHVLETAHDARLRPVVAVVPVWLTRPAAASEDLVWVRNGSPQLGMSHSLRLAFGALPADVRAAVILLGDQPTMSVQHIRSVVESRGERPLVAARIGGHVGPPVLVERSHFSLVDQPGGDIGLRTVLDAYPEWVLAVELGEAVPDIDTPDDLERIARP